MKHEWRPFAVTALVIGIPFSLFLTWTEAGLRPDLESRAAAQLSRSARLIAEEAGDTRLTDSLADRLGAAAGLRVTFIGPDGSVLGDSEVSAERIPQLDNHGSRPEIVGAMADSIGYGGRPSRSVALPLFYVAVRHRDAFVRVAVPARDLLEPLTHARQVAALTAVVALVLLLFIQRVLALSSRQGLQELREAIRTLGTDRATIQTHVRSGFVRDLMRDLQETAGSLAEQKVLAEQRIADLMQMLDAVEAGLASCDREGRVVRANRAFREWAGRSDPEGHGIGSLFRHPEPRTVVEAALEGRPLAVEAVLGTRTTEVRSIPLPGGALLVLSDISVTRRLEEVRRDFVANVSHEMKTPLTVIRGFAEPLADGGLSAEQTEEFSLRILANIERMQHLVDDLLDLARIESGAWSPEPSAVDIADVARRVWTLMEPVASAKGVGLDVEVDTDSMVRADPDSLRQILTNLLDNGVRYAHPNSSLRLAVSGPGKAGRLHIEISDRGPGIPSEHLPRVFERFYRSDAGRSRDAGGTGLGLAIVKNLVAAHGCDSGIESELGQGTTVWFDLPAAT
ncbi:MAG: hypothetical protein E4H28_07120 [Gemmatimonadales bacterium]|nr:MAG: hypothetical protein E4H28_07120 [Gemmatimonadales bacterium]